MNGKNEEQEIIRKRKQNQQLQQEEDDNLELKLSCSPTPSSTAPAPVPVPHQEETLQTVFELSPMETLLYESPTSRPLQLSANHSLYNAAFADPEAASSVMYPPQELALSSSPVNFQGSGAVSGGVPPRTLRVRRNPTKTLREGKSETVETPYPWATNYRATVHSLQYFSSKGICTITGDVQCKRCERQYKISYGLKEKFNEIVTYIARNKSSMHDRAPSVWRNPLLPKCKFCDQENSAKPVIALKKKAINWLFLLLGQMIGCCTLDQLKYFCKHTKNHRTGAKDRVLYLTYLTLCKQLDPTGPFDRES
ncbi:hypothetical protein F3Y22_tig00111027pilonHSYRG00116 [Hibiscus syriacus]|uniref:DUF7086 domain-containing protein n=1 Tax=Hibiscus syriacus TaxID=106335 RepID=A0A6A2Z4G7_HIBSY|nr:uncharacterized protein LOC120150894 [Hibiscus syriacus]KAE8686788.1 hypothetical protein F3Y22_tig00111027pilonHSYRG00116 [Hibiscus syriacus]